MSETLEKAKMARKMTLKWCPECGKDFKSRRTMAKHMQGYTRKYDGRVFDPCTGPNLKFNIKEFDRAINVGMVQEKHLYTQAAAAA